MAKVSAGTAGKKKVTDALELVDGSFRSPKGVANYAYLVKPDRYQDQGEPKNKITMTFSADDPEWIALRAKLLEIENNWRAQVGWAKVDSPTCVKDNEDGTASVNFSRKAKETAPGVFAPVPVVDAAVKPTTAPVWGGAICRVQFGIGQYVKAGRCGVKCYLNGVQLLKASESTGGGTSTFEVEAEYSGSEAAVSDESGGFEVEDLADVEELT